MSSTDVFAMLRRVTRDAVRELAPLEFAAPVSHVYNPLVYARKPHERYLKCFAGTPRECLMLGMNPGPYGMAQTGVPFGEVGLVRDWLGIEAAVSRPRPEHPRRPIEGFACPRSEVSGHRLWSWARDRFGTPEAFFSRFFVHNYCPLVFMADSGRNITPDKLPAAERGPLFEICDRLLVKVVHVLQPKIVLGVGAFAEQRARAALAGQVDSFGRIPHPSPASPAANRGWAPLADKALADVGIDL